MVDWLEQHGALLNADNPGYDALLHQVLLLHDDPRREQNPAYWPTIQRLVAVGQLSRAAELLLLHPAYSAPEANRAQVLCSALLGNK